MGPGSKRFESTGLTVIRNRLFIQRHHFISELHIYMPQCYFLLYLLSARSDCVIFKTRERALKDTIPME